MSNDTKVIAENYFSSLRQALAGIDANPLADFDSDITLILTGQTPISGIYKGMEEIAGLLGKLQEKFVSKPGLGLYPYRYIVEDNRVAVLAKGRSETKQGQPYNNHYFILMEIKAGKIIRIIEDPDAALIMTSVFDCHLSPAA